METIVRNTMVVKLVLNPSEAALLKSLVQNISPNEPEDVTDFKEQLFNALPPFEQLHKSEF